MSIILLTIMVRLYYTFLQILIHYIGNILVEVVIGSFVRSGHIYLPNTTSNFKNASNGGYYWSSHGVDIANAYDLLISGTTIHTSHGPSIRWHSFPLLLPTYSRFAVVLSLTAKQKNPTHEL